VFDLIVRQGIVDGRATDIGVTDGLIEAVAPELSGAHYGLAFLLLKREERDEAARHLEAFLAKPPKGAEAERWIQHARETLDALSAGDQTQAEP